MPTTAEWCAPTAELSTTELGSLTQRARRTSAIPALIRDARPRVDPLPPPMAPTWGAAGRRPRMMIRRITDAMVALAKPPVYPIAPSSNAWVLPVLVVVVWAAVAALYLLA